MFNMWILAKYAVILRVIGMNCTHDGAVVERSWSEWKPRCSDFLKIRSSLQSKSHRSTPRSAPILWLWVTVAVMTSISELVAIKIIWLRAILLLAGQLWPTGRLLPITGVDYHLAIHWLRDRLRSSETITEHESLCFTAKNALELIIHWKRFLLIYYIPPIKVTGAWVWKADRAKTL